MKKGSRKPLSAREREFIRLLVDAGLGPIEAARQSFHWRCEPGSSEAQRAKDLARTQRVLEAIEDYKAKLIQQQQAKQVAMTADALDINQLRDYALKELIAVRDDPTMKSSNRLRAVKALEKLADPSSDMNLIFKWMDAIWRYAEAHCPSCHNSFPLWHVFNNPLDRWREDYRAKPQTAPSTALERRTVAFKLGDNRRTPHPGQVRCLDAPERHLVCLSGARTGKSWFMGQFAAATLLIPGIEIWILGETYDSARKEREYLEYYLRTVLYPFDNGEMYTVNEDKKTGEIRITTKWASELRIRSAKSKGSITGSALELALAAEPGWIPEDVYEELRARIVERLGRILAFGTPKGTEGFIGRLVKMTGRDPKTGKILRRTPQERLISNGCPWNVSMYITSFSPEENPEYPISEVEAARQELTDLEFASEFKGEGVSAEGAKFPQVRREHLRNIEPSFYENCVYVLGIDQGPTNFGACLAAYNGHTITVCHEWFDNSINTMRQNLKTLYSEVPRWIKELGGNPKDWVYTIMDRHPPLDGNFYELQEEDGMEWPTDISTIPLNIRKIADNWRRDTAEFINNMAGADRIIFDGDHCWELHDDVMDVINKPMPVKDVNENDKGWTVNNPWRGDHVLDAWLFACYAVHSGRVLIPEKKPEPMGVWAEAKAGWDFRRMKEEGRELTGLLPDNKIGTEKEMWEKSFGRPRDSGIPIGNQGFYGDES